MLENEAEREAGVCVCVWRHFAVYAFAPALVCAMRGRGGRAHHSWPCLFVTALPEAIKFGFSRPHNPNTHTHTSALDRIAV